MTGYYWTCIICGARLPEAYSLLCSVKCKNEYFIKKYRLKPTRRKPCSVTCADLINTDLRKYSHVTPKTSD